MSWIVFTYRYSSRSIILLMGLVVNGCVVPLDNDPKTVNDIIVIEGFIDDDFGPHEVKVTAIAPFVSIQKGGEIKRLDAVVKIFDDLGNVTELERVSLERTEIFGAVNTDGTCPPTSVGGFEIQTNYLTPNSFKGEQGRSYSLEVEIDRAGNISTYRSSFVELLGSVPLDSLFFEFRIVPDQNDLQPRLGVYVLGSWQDPAVTKEYYMWEFEGTYRLETYSLCDLYFDCWYDPRDEFGEECWVIEQNVDNNLNLLSDNFFNGRRAVEKIGFIEDDGKRFSSNVIQSSKQYHVKATQYRLPEEAFEFYSVVKVLSEIDGEIFDPPPVRPVGNFLNLEIPEEVVIGYFGAFGKSTQSAFIDRSILLDRKFHGTCGDCRYFQYNGQLEIPDVYR